jgi:hypothetical protein
MQIRLQQSGGFAGIEQEPVRVDADRLPQPERDRLRALVEDAGFFALPPEAPAGIGADLPRYTVTVEDGDRAHTVSWNEDGGDASASLRALADAVQRAG